jgi:hypothetical protein
LLVEVIKGLVIGGKEEIEKFSGILKKDMVEASERSDVEFINKVIVPILRAEDRVPVTISTLDEDKHLL